ncbi:MAG: AMP-binding protein, partial [Pseudomonadota bacterium]
MVTSHLLKGATIIVEHTEITEKDFYDKLESERVTTFPCVPFHFDLFERIGFRQWDLPDLNYITQAGGALAPHLAKTYAAWAKETDKEFFIMYGATEATARMAYLSSHLAECHSDTIGQPVSNGQFHLLDPQGDLIEEVGEEGELVYTGPNVMLGYAEGREDLSKGRDHHQLHTGDMALKTADGLYKITGRISRFAKLYGKRFNLQDIENTLSAHGVTGATFSDDRSLFVATRQKDSHRLIVDLISEHFGIAPQDIKTREYQDLPTLSSGKIHYQALREDFARQEKEKAFLSTPQKSQKQALLDLYAETFLTEVSEEDSFRSLEGDSLRFIQISLGIEKIIGHLPQGWEDKPISALTEGQSKVKPKWLAEVETNVLIRVGAILLVLCNHGGAHFLKGGAHILLMVSAFNFVRFQYPQILQGKVKPFLSNFLVNVLIPYWGIILIYGLYRSNISWADIFLYRNIIGAPGSPGFGTWFIEVMVQGFFILILLSQVKGVKSQYQKHPFSVAMALLCFAIMMRIGHEMVFGVYKEPTWMFPFTAVLWVFMFGVVMAHAETTQQKIITTGLLALSVYLLH